MNWHERMAAARRNEGFTIGDSKLAGKWTTCACGKQDPRIPRDEDGAPQDDILFELGLSFARAVDSDNYDWAGDVLEKIDQRAQEIIDAM